MTGGLLENLSRATVWLDRGVTRRLERGFRRIRGLARRGAGAGGARAAQARPQDCDGGGLAALWRHARGASAIRAGSAQAARAAHGTQRTAQVAGAVKMTATEGEEGRARASSRQRGFPRAGARRPSCATFRPASSRRPGRRGRSERRGQDDADQPADGRARARRRQGEDRRSTSRWQRWTRPRDSWTRKTTLADVLTGGSGDMVSVGGEMRHVVGYMKDFLFTPRAGPHAGAAFCRAASADGCCWPKRWRSRRTCWCWTSRPTISIWKRSTCWRRCSPTIPVPCSWSAMTAISSTGSRPRS